MNQTILLIDDDAELVQLLSDYFAIEGYKVISAISGEEGIQTLSTAHVDIVVLDFMMPGMNGIQTLVKIRSSSNLPVIMLTARGDDSYRIMGLEFGADDYVSKPCSPRELVARIRAILKRTHIVAANIQPIFAGAITIWPALRRAEKSGQVLELTSTEFSLLEVLVRKAGHVVSKSELSFEGLGREFTRYDRSIDVHISSIRSKLGKMENGLPSIETVIRKGYQLIIG